MVDKINSCKSLKELSIYKKCFELYPLMKDDYEWDYNFLLNWIEFKLKRMSNYFATHNIVVNEEKYARQIQTCLNILHAGYKTQIILDTELGNIYVNTKNIRRFYNSRQIEAISRPNLNIYYRATIREEKAKVLFWKYLHHYIKYWWD